MLHITGIIRIGSLFVIGLAAAACGSAEQEIAASAGHDSVAAAISTRACSWAGTWNSTWSTPMASFKSPLVVTERGSALSGSYEIDPNNAGSVDGTVTGSEFSGTWKRTRGNSGGPCQEGELTARISDDCKTIAGEWYWCTGAARIHGGKLMGTR